MGGHVDIGLWPSGLIKSAVDSKRVKVLAAYKRNDEIDRGKDLEIMTEVSKFDKPDGYGIFLPPGAGPAVVAYWSKFIDDFKKDPVANQEYLNQHCAVYKNPGRRDLIDMIKTGTVSHNNQFDLSFRQQQIADLIINRGLTNAQIAQTLKITEGTVKLHTGILFKKVGVQSRTQLASLSFNIG
jgi:DNA-binding CsgD family transcriptional regulator